jgi:hypothetical protein
LTTRASIAPASTNAHYGQNGEKMNISQVTDLQALLDTYISHLDQEIERAEYESPRYWRLVTRRSAAVAAYEATV